MSHELDDKIRDIAIWFNQNRFRVPRENLAKRCDFLEKTTACLLDALIIATHDIMVLENRPLHKPLWLPSSVDLGNGTTPVKLR